MNYPYLTGYLQSEMESLAYDDKFLKMKNYETRLEYVRNKIKTAETKAVELEKEMKEKMSANRNKA